MSPTADPASARPEVVLAGDPHAVSDGVAFALLVLLLAGTLALIAAVIAGGLYLAQTLQ